MNPTSVFVRALWGDQPPSPYAKGPDEAGLGKNQIEVLNTWRRFAQPKPCLNFVWGKHNADFMRRNGIPFFEMSEAGNPGVSHWSRKLLCCERALELFDEVVWMDWDVRMVRPLPDDFWQQLRRGQCFQAKLHWYKKMRSWFRPLKNSPNPCVLPGGGCFYFRDLNLVRHCHNIFRRFQTATDEVVFALLYREMTQDWIDPEEFSERGFDIPFYLTKRVFQIPKEIVFSCGTFHEAVAKSTKSLVL
jgi:hypothetical protein